MIKLGQIFAGNAGNVLKEQIQFSFASQTLIRSKALENIRTPNPTRSSSIAITNLSYLTKLSSTHYVMNLNKSTDAKNSSSLILVDKKDKNIQKKKTKSCLNV